MKKYRSFLLPAVLFLIFFPGSAICFTQTIASFRVELTRDPFGLGVPVSINLDQITYLHDSALVLYEVKGKSKKTVPFQIEAGNPRELTWIIDSEGYNCNEHIYELAEGVNKQDDKIKALVKDGTLVIQGKEKNLLSYYFETIYPPAGVDSSYRRSGFIHPLWAPHGQVLTRIQPPDHYHHYGIWNPWTHVLFEGDTLDFWNINLKQGTVRFAGFVAIENGPVYSKFAARHEHIVLKDNKIKGVALNELQTVRVYSPGSSNDYFIVDFDILMNCSGMSPFKILEYRYAGFGWRTTEKWDNKNSMVLTSEGKSRKDADGSRARWCIVQGDIDDDYAGAIMMSFPSNYNFPEPLRIWPEDQYGRGDMFANFSPTKNTDWLLNPGKVYSLRYRLLVFNGKIDKNKAENAWYYFAYPPKVTTSPASKKSP